MPEIKKRKGKLILKSDKYLNFILNAIFVEFIVQFIIDVYRDSFTHFNVALQHQIISIFSRHASHIKQQLNF